MAPEKKLSSSPIIVGIAGGSCSGKTLLASALKKVIGDRAVLILQDHYYIDQSDKFDFDGGSVNFDHPSAIEFALLADHLAKLKNGLGVGIPTYDFKKHVRTEATTLIKSVPFVIVEGTMVLRSPVIEVLDLKVFVEADEKSRLARRIKRDTQERGRQEAGVRAQFAKQVQPMHMQFVQPQNNCADIIVKNTSHEGEFVNEGIGVIQKWLYERTHFRLK